MNGVVNLLKPPGMTSHDAVAIARRLFNQRRIGHGGTLDPGVSGVLPLFLGWATRLVRFMPDDKRYRAEMTLGISTDTQDGGEQRSRWHTKYISLLANWGSVRRVFGCHRADTSHVVRRSSGRPSSL